MARIISHAVLEAPVHTHCHTLGLSGCVRVSCGCVRSVVNILCFFLQMQRFCDVLSLTSRTVPNISRKIIAQHQGAVHPSISLHLCKSRKSYLSLGDSLLAFCCFFFFFTPLTRNDFQSLLGQPGLYVIPPGESCTYPGTFAQVDVPGTQFGFSPFLMPGRRASLLCDFLRMFELLAVSLQV